MTPVMYIDLVLYVAIFMRCSKTAGFSLFLAMAGVVIYNLNDSHYFLYVPILILCSLIVFIKGGINHQTLGVIFLCKAGLVYLYSDSYLVDLIVIISIIIAIDTDDNGTPKGTYDNILERFRRFRTVHFCSMAGCLQRHSHESD